DLEHRHSRFCLGFSAPYGQRGDHQTIRSSGVFPQKSRKSDDHLPATGWKTSRARSSQIGPMRTEPWFFPRPTRSQPPLDSPPPCRESSETCSRSAHSSSPRSEPTENGRVSQWDAVRPPNAGPHTWRRILLDEPSGKTAPGPKTPPNTKVRQAGIFPNP